MSGSNKFVFVRGMPSSILRKKLITRILNPQKTIPQKRQKKEIKVVETESFAEVIKRAELELERLRAEKRAIFVKISERNKRKREVTAQKMIVSETNNLNVALDGNTSNTKDIHPSQFNDHLDQNTSNREKTATEMRSPDMQGQDFKRRQENKFMKKTSQFMQRRL